MNYQALMYDPIYSALGVPATLSGMAGETLTVIEKTVADEQSNVQTVKPAAAVRATELAAKGVSLASLRNQSITFNGSSRRIEYHKIVPSPNGEADGEIYLVLIEAD